MSGISRSSRRLCPHTKKTGGDNTSQTSLALDRGGSAVYVQYNANQKTKRRIKPPHTYNEKHLDDDNEVLVAKFDYKEFVWWSEYLTGELPLLYQQVLEKLGVWKSEYGFELQGFTCFRHKDDKNRKCDVKHIYLPQVWCGKYHPYASVKHKRRASMRILERLEYLEKKVRKLNGKFDYLVKIDLTLPKYVSLKWNDKDTQIRIRNALKRFLDLLHNELFPINFSLECGDEDREIELKNALKDFLNLVHGDNEATEIKKRNAFKHFLDLLHDDELLRKHKSQFGVICNHHFWRTYYPLKPHRHLHLTIPNVCYNKSENMFYRFKPYLDQELVKRCWKKALTEYDLWIEKKDEKDEEDSLPDCWLGYIKFSDRNKVINRLSYCCRKPTEDLINHLMPEDLDSFEDAKEFANFLINYTPRVVNLGFLTNLKRFGYYSNKSKSMICPICGGEMVALQDKNGIIESLDRPPPHAPKLLRDRKGVWYVLSKRCRSQ